MNSRYSQITSTIFARDWTKYDYVTETRFDAMKRKLSKAIDCLRNKIQYNQKIVGGLQEELRVQVENFRKDYPLCISAEKARDRRTVFVCHIAKEASIAELKWHFEMCGIIEDVILFRKDEKSQGAAYVEFKDEISANIALCMAKSLFMGQKIDIVPRNMTVELNIMQAITTFWGQHLESQFEYVRYIKSRIRSINTLSKYVYELMQLYVDISNSENSRSANKVHTLIKKSKILLRIVHDYRRKATTAL